jgi:hypothetical protein
MKNRLLLLALALASAALAFALVRGLTRRSAPDGAPFIVCQPDREAELVFASDAGGWAEALAALPFLGEKKVLAVPPLGPDGKVWPGGRRGAWTTDEWEFGRVGKQPAVLVLPGKKLLAPWGAPKFQELGIRVFEIGDHRPFPEERLDAGGNIICSPPFPGAPNGRLIVGKEIHPAVKEFLRAQKAQTGPGGSLIEIEAAWCKVGHVDEFIVFLPSPAGKGFKVGLADPAAGLKLLGSVPAETAVFASGRQWVGSVCSYGPGFVEFEAPVPAGGLRFLRVISGRGAGQLARLGKADGGRFEIGEVWSLSGESASLALIKARESCPPRATWFEPPAAGDRCLLVEGSRMWMDAAAQEFPALISAGEMAADPVLGANCAAWDRRMFGPGGVKDALARELGLADADFVRLPTVSCGDANGQWAAPWVPNNVLMVVFGKNAVLLRPFGPRDAAGADVDVFERAFREALAPTGLEPVFIDGWNACNRLYAGADCATSVLRAR